MKTAHTARSLRELRARLDYIAAIRANLPTDTDALRRYDEYLIGVRNTLLWAIGGADTDAHINGAANAIFETHARRYGGGCNCGVCVRMRQSGGVR